MTKPHEANDAPDSFNDLRPQPTGSGVADLEIAYEQMKVAEGNDLSMDRVGADMIGSSAASGAGEAASEAHPS